MTTVRGSFHEFEIVWASAGAPKGLRDAVTGDSELHITEGGVLTITATTRGVIYCAPHTWTHLTRRPGLAPTSGLHFT